MRSGQKYIVWGLVLLCLVVAGCAAGNQRFEAKPAGFWAGLWHGFICVVTFIISLFSAKVRMYEIHNVGGWYNFGFTFGASIIFGGTGRGAARRRR